MSITKTWQSIRVRLYAGLLLAWVILTYTIVFQRLEQHQLLVNSDGHSIQVIDFVHFYEAGQLASSEKTRLHVYDVDVQTAWMNDFVKPARPAKVFYLQYMPFVFPLMLPLSQLTPEAAFLLWFGLSILSTIAGCVVLSKLFGASNDTTAFITIALFATIPCWNSLTIGQIAGYLLFFIAMYFYGLRKNKNSLAGVFLAFTSVKPHYAIFLAIPALAQRRFSVIAFAAVTELVLIVLAGLTIGWHNIVDYPRILMHSETAEEFAGLNPAFEACIRGLLSQFLPEKLALSLSLVAWVLGACAVFYVWLRASKFVKAETMAVVIPAETTGAAAIAAAGEPSPGAASEAAIGSVPGSASDATIAAGTEASAGSASDATIAAGTEASAGSASEATIAAGTGVSAGLTTGSATGPATDEYLAKYAWPVALTVIMFLAMSPHTHLYDWTLLAVAACATTPAILSLAQRDGATKTWFRLLFWYPWLSWVMMLTGNLIKRPGSSVFLESIIHFVLLGICAAITWRTLAPEKEQKPAVNIQ